MHIHTYIRIRAKPGAHAHTHTHPTTSIYSFGYTLAMLEAIIMEMTEDRIATMSAEFIMMPADSIIMSNGIAKIRDHGRRPYYYDV